MVKETTMPQIRDSSAADAGVIATLIRELGDDCEVTPVYAAHYLNCSGNTVLLCEANAEVIGLVSCCIRPSLFHGGDACLIEDFVVEEGYRRRGVGHALLTALVRRAELLGCKEISVSTLPNNTGALRFYRSHGLTDEAVFLEKHL